MEENWHYVHKENTKKIGSMCSFGLDKIGPHERCTFLPEVGMYMLNRVVELIKKKQKQQLHETSKAFQHCQEL